MKKPADIVVDDILYAFSVEKNRDKDTLKKYLQKYPEYKEELIDLSIELLSASTEQGFSRAGISKSASIAWDKFQAILPSSDPLSSNSIEFNPLATLDRPAFRSLAIKLGLNTLFLTMLRDRTIKGSTIPINFVILVSDAIGESVEVMKTALSGPPVISSATSYKADAAPIAENQITFDEAINSSQLTEQQKAALMAMKD